MELRYWARSKAKLWGFEHNVAVDKEVSAAISRGLEIPDSHVTVPQPGVIAVQKSQRKGCHFITDPFSDDSTCTCETFMRGAAVCKHICKLRHMCGWTETAQYNVYVLQQSPPEPYCTIPAALSAAMQLPGSAVQPPSSLPDGVTLDTDPKAVAGMPATCPSAPEAEEPAASNQVEGPSSPLASPAASVPTSAYSTPAKSEAPTVEAAPRQPISEQLAGYREHAANLEALLMRRPDLASYAASAIQGLHGHLSQVAARTQFAASTRAAAPLQKVDDGTADTVCRLPSFMDGRVFKGRRGGKRPQQHGPPVGPESPAAHAAPQAAAPALQPAQMDPTRGPTQEEQLLARAKSMLLQVPETLQPMAAAAGERVSWRITCSYEVWTKPGACYA